MPEMVALEQEAPISTKKQIRESLRMSGRTSRLVNDHERLVPLSMGIPPEGGAATRARNTLQLEVRVSARGGLLSIRGLAESSTRDRRTTWKPDA